MKKTNKYYVWVGGTPNIFESLIDAEIEKQNGLIKVIMKSILKLNKLINSINMKTKKINIKK